MIRFYKLDFVRTSPHYEVVDTRFCLSRTGAYTVASECVERVRSRRVRPKWSRIVVSEVDVDSNGSFSRFQFSVELGA